MIDPGHGGSDPGAQANGLREKDLVLTIGLAMRDYLIAEYENVEVRMTRDTDSFLTLEQRANLANAWGADYFISVHVNAGGGTGFESFIHTTRSTGSVNAQNIVHDEILKLIGVTDRGKKEANFSVLRNTSMPAILTEVLFIDRTTDAARLRDPNFLITAAQGHVNGLAKAFNLKRRGGTVGANTHLSEGQERDRQLVIDYGLTDGRNPRNQVDNLYVWQMMAQLIRKIESGEIKSK